MSLKHLPLKGTANRMPYSQLDDLFKKTFFPVYSFIKTPHTQT